MKLNKILLVFLLGMLFLGSNDEQVYGNTNDTPQPFEKFFIEGGYKTVEAALDDFEKHFKQELKLPLRVPPISFTHHFGRFSNLDGESNDAFEVVFINDQIPENHFKINIRPIKHKIGFSDKYVSKTCTLDNGSVAKYMEKPIIGFNLLVFERDGWEYVFSIDKKVSITVTPELLVQIADSIDF